jgi:hypothetical protein
MLWLLSEKYLLLLSLVVLLFLTGWVGGVGEGKQEVGWAEGGPFAKCTEEGLRSSSRLLHR